jgi:hypothetical protein
MIGIALIVIGVLALIATLIQSELFGLLIVPVVGILLLLYGGISGRVGFMIPGSIVTGVGLGTLISQELMPDANATVQSGVIVIGLALGFLAIPPIRQVSASRHPFWPWIPGGILLIVGICLIVGGPLLNVLAFIGTYFWPLVLVAVGAYLLWRAYNPSQRDRERHRLLHHQQ